MDFYLKLDPMIINKARQIKLLMMDVDGVLCDGLLHYYPNQETPGKNFFVRDGLGLVMVRQMGLQTAIITGRDDKVVAKRAEELKINHYVAGVQDKAVAWHMLSEQTNFKANECAYIADDLIDLPILGKVGLAIAVQDAHPMLFPYCDYTTQAQGGKGAVREVCDILLYAQDHLDALLKDQWPYA